MDYKQRTKIADIIDAAITREYGEDIQRTLSGCLPAKVTSSADQTHGDKMTIDIKQSLNYSDAVRKAEPDWDDDKVRAAAEYLVLYMDVRLKPYKGKTQEFDSDGGFCIEKPH